MRHHIAAAVLICGWIASQVWAEATGEAMHTDAREPYAVETFGVFQKMMLEGEFNPKVTMESALAKHPTTGVGAVADARGEITIHDGTLVISYGKPGEQPPPNQEKAALLAIGAAKNWQSIRVDRNVSPEEVEAFIAETAKAHGVDPDKSFPFEIRGNVAPYATDVNASPTNGPHGMGLPMAITVQKKGPKITGDVAALYVSPDLVGVATHGGERTHAHWVSPDGRSTAHLDSWGIGAGSTLRLPKP